MFKYQEMFPEIRDAKEPFDFFKFIRIGKESSAPYGDPQYLKYEDFDNETETEFEAYIKACLEKAEYTPGEYEFKLIQLLLESLINRKILTEDLHSSAVDLVIAATLLHNVYVDKEHPYTSLFKAREEFLPLLDEGDFRKIPRALIEIVFETIEKQFGENAPLKEMIPQNGTITDLFANCVWLVRESGFISEA